MKKDGKAEPEFVFEKQHGCHTIGGQAPSVRFMLLLGGAAESGDDKRPRYELGGNILREQQCLIWDEMPVAIINANLFF